MYVCKNTLKKVWVYLYDNFTGYGSYTSLVFGVRIYLQDS